MYITLNYNMSRLNVGVCGDWRPHKFLIHFIFVCLSPTKQYGEAD